MSTATPDTAVSAAPLRLITTDEFVQKARISKSTLSRLEKSDPSFPKPGRLATRGTRLWNESTVDEYLLGKLATPAAPNDGRVERAVRQSVQARANRRGRSPSDGNSSSRRGDAAKPARKTSAATAQ